MIPKIVHYCWLGDDEYSELVKKCIQSWRNKLPDWEFKLWDKNSIKEINSTWVNEAYQVKKYAFAADYIRLYAVYNYGGFYLDSDVEVLKDFAPLLAQPYVMALENAGGDIEAATFGAEPHNSFIKKCFDYYQNKSFIKSDGSFDTLPLPKILKECLPNTVIINSPSNFEKTCNSVQLFPVSYFSPKDSGTGKLLNLTDETFSIHHFTASWFSTSQWLFRILSRMLGFRIAKFISRMYKKIAK